MSKPQDSFIVFEGEWVSLKAFVTYCRQNFLGIKADLDVHVDVAKDKGGQLIRQSDGALVRVSHSISSLLRNSPWMLPAFGIGSASSFVCIKSLRWGTKSAVRNGLFTATGLTLWLYPHHVQEFVWTRLSRPFSASSEKTSV